jgi:predicted permease
MSIWTRLQGTFSRRDVEARLDDELQFHLDMRAEELVAAGHSEADARAMARRQLGNSTKLREEAREVDMVLWIENWGRDLRQSARSLRKRPVFALTAVASLAIGIGAVTSLFSVMDAVLWKPVALPDEGQLIFLDEYKRGAPVGSNGQRLKDWQTLTSLESATGSYGEMLVWRGPDGPESVDGHRIFTGCVKTLGIRTTLGRTFTPEEERGGAVAILTDGFWRRRFHADPGVLDRTIELDGKAFRVIGVMSPAIGYPEDKDVWLPAEADLQNGSRRAGYLGIVGRLKPGVTFAQAQAEVNTVATRLQADHPETDAGLRASLTGLRERIGKEARTPLLILFGVVASVMLMIAVNLSALLLARAGERRRESSLRAALGATAASLIRLYLAETLMLALAGGLLGLIIALTGVDILKAILPGNLPRLTNATLDWRVFAFAAALSLMVSLIAGLIPSWLAARDSSIKDDGRATAGSGGARLRNAFVIGEIALSCLLVTTAVRMAETFSEISQRTQAFQSGQKIAVTVPFSWTSPGERVTSFNKAALERFAAMPGVTQVGLIDRLPFGGGTQDGEIKIQGMNASTVMRSGKRSASSSYFAALGVPLLRGRLFADRAERQEAVVNETFVRRILNHEDPIGRRILFGKESYEIVGVAGNILQEPTLTEARPEFFIYSESGGWPVSNFVIRATAPLSVLAAQIRKEVAAVDPMITITQLTTLDEAVGESARTPRVRSYLIGGFALLALLLAAIGIHGLFAADVATRWKEFGVRLALGGTVPSLRGLLMRRAAWLLAIGCGLGVVAVALTSKVLESAVEGLEPARLTTGFAVAALVLLAALGAIWWPLRRLAKVDPASALRHD